MRDALRDLWRANAHRVVAGLIVAIVLFVSVNLVRRDARSRIAQQKGTGLASVAYHEPGLWQRSTARSSYSRKTRAVSEQATSGTVGGVPIRVAGLNLALPQDAEQKVVRTAALDIECANPAKAAEQLNDIATGFSGLIVSSKITGADEQMRWAEVTLSVPAKHFDAVRTAVRKLAKSVEQDSIEAQDVTRQYTDQEATLRHYRAEETQYLAILRRAHTVKDVLEVSSKLDDVQESIDQLERDIRTLHRQVDMSVLNVHIRSVSEDQVFGINWRPLYQARISLRSALTGLADYADSMVAFALYVPVIIAWTITVIGLAKLGWILLRPVLLLFPALASWRRRPPQLQPS